MSVQGIGNNGYIFDIVQLTADTQMRNAQNAVEVNAKVQLTADQLSNIQAAQSALDIRV